MKWYGSAVAQVPKIESSYELGVFHLKNAFHRLRILKIAESMNSTQLHSQKGGAKEAHSARVDVTLWNTLVATSMYVKDGATTFTSTVEIGNNRQAKNLNV
jgi:hypothetical protein